MSILREEKKGKGKPTSGLTALTSKKKHTGKSVESKKLKSVKITPEGPGNKAVATSKPDKVQNDVKVMDTTKKPLPKSDSFKFEDLGVELEVSGLSHANVNALMIITTLKKLLEGKGQIVKKIKVEMGDKKELKNENSIRKLIQDLIIEAIRR